MPTLKARIGGAWVPIGGGAGADEVFVGPNDPGTGAGYELWVDSDAPGASNVVPVGYVAHVVGPETTQTGIGTSPTLVTGMSVTVSLTAGRTYRISSQVTGYLESAAPQLLIAEVQINGVQWRQSGALFTANATSMYPLPVEGIYVPSASGAVTVRTMLQCTGGTCAYDGRFGRVGFLLIEDITPVTPSTTSVIESGSYTPTLILLSQGTGGGAANVAYYSFAGPPGINVVGQMTIHGTIIFGTTGMSIGSFPGVELPPGFDIWGAVQNGHIIGSAYLIDMGTAGYIGYMLRHGTNFRSALIAVPGVSATYPSQVIVSPTVPFTWVAGDQIGWTLNCLAVRTV